MATLKELAEVTGLSMNTVSRAIRGRGYVSERARKLVRDAVRKLDYHPNKAAQALRRQDSREIAVIEHDYKSFHLTMHLFLCDLVGKDPVIKEHLAFKWITAAEVHSQDWAPADYQILDTVCSECFN